MGATWSDFTSTFRVDVDIQGTNKATINYATSADMLGVLKSVAMAFENDEFENADNDDFATMVTEIRITRNPLPNYEIPSTGIRVPK